MAEIQYLTVPHLPSKRIISIFSRIDRDPKTDCWVWRGARDASGYGFTSYGNKYHRVHRVMYAWAIGPVPLGFAGRAISQIDHLCRNTSCCNPAHLELVSPRTNVARGTSVVAKLMKHTHCPRGHLLTLTKRGNRRECKPCDNERHRVRANGPNREYWLQKAREGYYRYAAKKKVALRLDHVD